MKKGGIQKMKLGTVVYEGKIYNLDYMNTNEVTELLKKIEKKKASEISQGKNITKILPSLTTDL